MFSLDISWFTMGMSSWQLVRESETQGGSQNLGHNFGIYQQKVAI